MARPLGSKNKRTLDLEAKLAAAFGADYDPVMDLLKAARTGRLPTYDYETGKEIAPVILDTDQRVTLAKEAIQYISPKLKAVEHSGDVETGVAGTQLLLPGNAPDLKAWAILVTENANRCASQPNELPAILVLPEEPAEGADDESEG